MRVLIFAFIFSSSVLMAQVHVYDVELFGRKIGTSTIQRTDNGNGEVRYRLLSSSAVNIFFINKTSFMDFDVVYKDGKLFSAYCKNVKDEVTEVTTVLWDGMKYVINKKGETLHLNQMIDFSAILLYFTEPGGRSKIFSERIGIFCDYLKEKEGVYSCKLSNGVNNIYRYKNGLLYELEMSKGASVYMRLVE